MRLIIRRTNPRPLRIRPNQMRPIMLDQIHHHPLLQNLVHHTLAQRKHVFGGVHFLLVDSTAFDADGVD